MAEPKEKHKPKKRDIMEVLESMLFDARNNPSRRRATRSYNNRSLDKEFESKTGVYYRTSEIDCEDTDIHYHDGRSDKS